MDMLPEDLRRWAMKMYSDPPASGTMEEQKLRILEEVAFSLQRVENMRNLRDAWISGTDINYPKALDMARQVVEYDVNTFGKTSDATIGDQYILAQLLLKTGNYRSAAWLFRKLSTRENRSSDVKDRLSLAMLQGEADALLGLKKFRRAKVIMENVLERRRTIFGSDDPDTLDSIYQLAVLLARSGKKAAAVSMASQAYQGRKTVLGKGHPDTLATQRFLLEHNSAHGLLERERILDEFYSTCKDTLGAHHPETMLALFDLARVHTKQRQYLEAALEVETVHEHISAAFGNEHPTALDVIQLQAHCWFMVGDLHLFRCCMEVLFLGWYIRCSDWELYYISRLEEWRDRRKRLRKKRRENQAKAKEPT